MELAFDSPKRTPRWGRRAFSSAQPVKALSRQKVCRMTENDLETGPDGAPLELEDNGGMRSGEDRRVGPETFDGTERRSGKDRRRGFDRRSGLPRRRQPDRRDGNRYYWNGTAVERRDAFRNGGNH